MRPDKEATQTTDSPADDDTRDDSGVEPGLGSRASMPLWVRVFGIVVLIVVVLFVVVMLAGGGHGPGLHAP